MIFKIFLTIVFIAEIIITIAVLTMLIKFDKKVLSVNDFIVESNPNINDICSLIHKISAQLKDLSIDFVDKLRREQEEAMYNRLLKILTILLLWKINSKTINKISESRIAKAFGKGLSFLENMI